MLDLSNLFRIFAKVQQTNTINSIMKFKTIINKFCKRTIVAFSTLFFTISSIANTAQTEELVIWLKNGEKIQLELSDSLKTFFFKGNIIVESESTVFQWPIDSIIKYTYILPSSRVVTANANSDIKISCLNDMLTIVTTNPGISVKLWAIDGVLINYWDSNNESKMSISLSGYTAGIYVLEINGFSHKIVKR